jgi:hypothetical protein
LFRQQLVTHCFFVPFILVQIYINKNEMNEEQWAIRNKKDAEGSGWQIVSSEKGKIQSGKLRFDKISRGNVAKNRKGGR